MADVFCPNCGYNLYGIPEVRCPECGFHYDHAAIVSIANDEAVATRVLTGRVIVRSLFALACVAAPIVTAIHWPSRAGMAVMMTSFIGAAALRRYLTQAQPFDLPEFLPRLAAWIGVFGAVTVLLLLLPRVASMAATVILVDAWYLFAQCRRGQTLALLSLPTQEQKRVVRQTRWTGVGLVVVSLITMLSWAF